MGGRDSPTCFWVVWPNTWSARARVPCWWSAEPLTPRLRRRLGCLSSHEEETRVVQSGWCAVGMREAQDMWTSGDRTGNGLKGKLRYNCHVPRNTTTHENRIFKVATHLSLG